MKSFYKVVDVRNICHMPLCHPINWRLKICVSVLSLFWTKLSGRNSEQKPRLFFRQNKPKTTWKCSRLFDLLYIYREKKNSNFINNSWINVHKSSNTLHIQLGFAETQFVNKQINCASSNIGCFPFWICLIKVNEY